MTVEKFGVTAFGLYMLGYSLERAEWASNTHDGAKDLSNFFGALRAYETMAPFESIGVEAARLSDVLSTYEDELVNEADKGTLKSTISKWHSVIQERVVDLQLFVPDTKLQCTKLGKGIQEFLADGEFSKLDPTEISDLNESCRCILMGSSTAAEHMALRAAESLLRRWYEHISDNTLRYRTWGTVLNRLVKLYPEKKRPKELTLLSYLKLRRDEIAHPDRVSHLLDAETTFMNVCTLIKGLGKDLSVLPVRSERLELSNASDLPAHQRS